MAFSPAMPGTSRQRRHFCSVHGFTFNERHRFVHTGMLDHWMQTLQVSKRLRPWREWRAAGNLPDDYGMRECQIPIEQVFQRRIAVPKMVNPHGSVDKHATHWTGSGLRRGTFTISDTVRRR